MKRTAFARTGAACLAGLLLLTPAGQAFSNEPASWAADSIDMLNHKALLYNLLPDAERLDSKSPITRGEFCQLLVGVARSEFSQTLIESIAPKPADHFLDIARTVSEDKPGGEYDMYYAAAYGLTEGAGYGSGRVADCESELTREQAAKMMCALVDFLEEHSGQSLYTRGEPTAFTDMDQVSSWAAESVTKASACGIMKGDQNQRFNPAGKLTWEEACVMAARANQAADRVRMDRAAEEGVRWLDVEGQLTPSYGVYGTQVYPLMDGDSLQLLYLFSKPKVETFRADGTSAGVRQLDNELLNCVAFCQSDEYYFICFSQSNQKLEDDKEVYRVVKYDHQWNRLGAASVTGGASNTSAPSQLHHTGMAIQGDTLIVHTARQMYPDAAGTRHQANLTFEVDIPTMTASVPNDSPTYVSHSFAQYAVRDGEKMVYVDQGDAYPARGFILSTKGGAGEIPVWQNIFPFAGAEGDNTTNADPGGLGVSPTHYLFLASSAPQQGSGEGEKDQNVVLISVPKAGFPNGTPQVQQLTHFTGGTEWVANPKLVRVDDNTFVAMWQSSKSCERVDSAPGDFCYAVFDGTGRQIGQTVTKPDFQAPVADPVVVGDTIYWVMYDGGLLYQTYGGREHAALFSLTVPRNP